jgi:hypothetical protein
MLLFERRGGLIEGLVGKYRVLTENDVTTAIGIDIGQIPQGAAPDGRLIAQLDATHLLDEPVRDWLRTLDISGRVTVVWLFEREGIEIDYTEFATYHDDLWYPGSDDVWVIAHDGSRVVQMDHEELFYFYERDSDSSLSPDTPRRLYFPERETPDKPVWRRYLTWQQP